MQQALKKDSLFITGSGGYIGEALLKYLGQKKEITLSYRQKRPSQEGKNLRLLCVDFRNQDTLCLALRGVQTVVHLAWDKEQKEENLIITKNLVLACEKAGVERFVFISPEETNFRVKNSLLKNKFLAEQIILGSALKERLIFRIPPVIGEDISKSIFYPILKKFLLIPGFYPLPPHFERLQFMSLSELVSQINLRIEKMPENRAYILTLDAAERFSWRMLLEKVIEHDNRKKAFPIKGFFGQAFLFLLERYWGVQGKPLGASFLWREVKEIS